MKADFAKGGAGTLKKRLTRDWNMNKWKYVMIIPVLVYLALFCYKPMYGLIIAFKDYKITKGSRAHPGQIPGTNGLSISSRILISRVLSRIHSCSAG